MNKLQESDFEEAGFKLEEEAGELPPLYKRRINDNDWWLLLPNFYDEGCWIDIRKVCTHNRISGGHFTGDLKTREEFNKVLEQIGDGDF